ncbi:MAG TPA: ribonuclease D [Tepidisphaeraceae bacterium]|nr:ribonuclease D [Tepidisphaeraceae bacterium]
MSTEPSSNARRARYARSQYRAQSHDAGHATEGDHPDDESGRAHHDLAPRGPASLVNTQEGLSELVSHLRQAGRFGYDSEFIGELTYTPKLCVIQVASAARVALIDPLVPGLELREFWELVADTAVEKIVHAGQQDIEPVFRNIGKPAANIFDTQIATGFIGMAYPVALGKLVQELVGVRLGKALTFSHWDQRPLSPMQLRYAADDVRYLPALRQEIGKRLEQTGHAAWAKAESEALCEPSQYLFNPKTYYQRVRGATSLPPQGLAVLRELTIWRDQIARKHDVPPRAYLKDEILLDLSRTPIKSVDRLGKVRGLPRPVEHESGADLVAATLRGLATPTKDLPASRTFEPSPVERFRVDALWAAAQVLCSGRSIDAALVTSRNEIGEFYRAVTSGEDLKSLNLSQGWRREALGEPLAKLMCGETRLGMRWADGRLSVLPE